MLGRILPKLYFVAHPKTRIWLFSSVLIANRFGVISSTRRKLKLTTVNY